MLRMGDNLRMDRLYLSLQVGSISAWPVATARSVASLGAAAAIASAAIAPTALSAVPLTMGFQSVSTSMCIFPCLFMVPDITLDHARKQEKTMKQFT